MSTKTSFFVGAKKGSKFVTDKSDYIRRLWWFQIYIKNKKNKKNRLTPDGTISLPGADASHVYTFSEGADSVGRQVRGDKECPFSGVTR